MNVGGSIYILKGNFSLKLEKVLDPPFKGRVQVFSVTQRLDSLLYEDTPANIHFFQNPTLAVATPTAVSEPLPQVLQTVYSSTISSVLKDLKRRSLVL